MLKNRIQDFQPLNNFLPRIFNCTSSTKGGYWVPSDPANSRHCPFTPDLIENILFVPFIPNIPDLGLFGNYEHKHKHTHSHSLSHTYTDTHTLSLSLCLTFEHLQWVQGCPTRSRLIFSSLPLPL